MNIAKQSASNVANYSIAVVGSGICGPMIAGMLAKEYGKRLQIDIYERASRERDQGYGLDLDEYGQEALKQAGVFENYWRISRPYSDTMKFYSFNSKQPKAVRFKSKILQYFFPDYFIAQPESSRDGIRQILLDGFISRNGGKIVYDTQIHSVKKIPDSLKVDLLDKEENSLGAYDLVIDACGVHSPLRKLRVYPSNLVEEERIIIHGVAYDPDSVAGPQFSSRLGEGSLFVTAGYNKTLVFQRFMPSLEDKSTSFFYQKMTSKSHDEFWQEIGISKTKSRKDGIMTDKERLSKIQTYLLNEFNQLDPIYQKAIMSMNRFTISPLVSHIHSGKIIENEIPLICIGDSLRNIGLGGGGNSGAEDCLFLMECLKEINAFPTEVPQQSPFSMAKLLAYQKARYQAKQSFVNARETTMKISNESKGQWKENVTLNDFFGSLPLYKRVPVITFICTVNFWYKMERFLGFKEGSPPPPIKTVDARDCPNKFQRERNLLKQQKFAKVSPSVVNLTKIMRNSKKI